MLAGYTFAPVVVSVNHELTDVNPTGFAVNGVMAAAMTETGSRVSTTLHMNT